MQDERLRNLLRDLAALDVREEPSARAQERVMQRWANRTETGRATASTAPARRRRLSVWSPVHVSLGFSTLAAAILFVAWMRTPLPEESGFGTRASGLAIRAPGSEFRTPNAEPRAPGPELRVRRSEARGPNAKPRVLTPEPAVPSPEIDIEPFVRLLPMTDQELGTVRLARVRFRDQAAGTLGLNLRVPAPGPDGFVEADVLLGEDGLARAIRFTR